uniref:BHLH domain-containing protein n=1 Tax=Cyprinodon variegatus TaxID=28743 RepID=A0A3Q2CUJ7_CYPVA
LRFQSDRFLIILHFTLRLRVTAIFCLEHHSVNGSYGNCCCHFSFYQNKRRKHPVEPWKHRETQENIKIKARILKRKVDNLLSILDSVSSLLLNTLQCSKILAPSY